jgi:hypothetical protein
MMRSDIIEIGGPKISDVTIESVDLNDLSSSKRLPSVNFGGGIELLMNDKVKSSRDKTAASSDIDLGDINDLENDLNDLAALEKPAERPKGKTRSDLFSSMMNRGGGSSAAINESGFDDVAESRSQSAFIKIGRETARDLEEPKTFDGFQRFNDIPVDPTKNISMGAAAMSKEELLREKFKYLRRLEELEEKGVKLSKKYNMESNLQEMQGEYEMILAEKEKSNSVKFQGKMLMAAITGLEFLNNKFDPFDVKLDGWSEQCNENINDYDEIFSELHEKYKSKAKMAPEVKLLFQLAGSAIMVHMTNTMFKSAMPGMDDIMRQNPELMQQFTQAAVNSMSNTNPGFGGFVNNFMPGSGAANMHPSMPQPPPPPPMATQNVVYRPNQQGSGPSNRPDLTSARGDGINIQETFGKAGGAERSTKRPEMKGPRDINDIISNIKTKSININQSASATSAPTSQLKFSSNTKEDAGGSTISINDVEDLKIGKTPKSKRKQKSEKNTISLDI